MDAEYRHCWGGFTSPCKRHPRNPVSVVGWHRIEDLLTARGQSVYHKNIGSVYNGGSGMERLPISRSKFHHILLDDDADEYPTERETSYDFYRPWMFPHRNHPRRIRATVAREFEPDHAHTPACQRHAARLALLPAPFRNHFSWRDDEMMLHNPFSLVCGGTTIICSSSHTVLQRLR